MKARKTTFWWAFLGLSIVIACESDSSRDPWTRTDLWSERPAIADRRFRPTHQRAVTTLVPAGASELRDVDTLNEWQRRPAARVGAGLIRAIEQSAGTVLIKPVHLGDDPFFSFVPIPEEASDSSCEFGVSVRVGRGQPVQLLSHGCSRELIPAPDTLYVDLSRYQGETVELLLSLDGTPGARAFWGSPAVFSRKEAPAMKESRPERPNVVLIGIDTLRAEALGAYGRSPSFTPAIDRLAAESDVWMEAYSVFNATVPSFTSMFSGLWGKHHGVYDHATRVPPELVMLPELFSEAGYETAAIAGARHLETAGLLADFDHIVSPANYFRGETPVDEAMNWIGDREGNFFCFVHLFDPHTPHVPPGRFVRGYGPDGLFGVGEVTRWTMMREPGDPEFSKGSREASTELYYAEVAYVDRQIDRLIDFLRSRDLLSNTIIVFVADHGENLEEHGIQYDHTGLWDTTVHVPMMIRWPGDDQRGRRVEGMVQTIDLFPTLLTAAGIRVPPNDGEPLKELERRGGRLAVFAEHSNRFGEMIRTRSFKYMRSSGNARMESGPYLYDLHRDPDELGNLAGSGVEDELRLSGALDNWVAARADDPGSPLDLDQEDRARLRALGYLQ